MTSFTLQRKYHNTAIQWKKQQPGSPHKTQICIIESFGIQRSRREKLYHELGLESFHRRRRYRKLCFFYKIFKENKPVYLVNLIPTKNSYYNNRNTDKITLFHGKHNFFKNSFFHKLLLNGTSKIPIFEVPLVLVFSKKIY